VAEITSARSGDSITASELQGDAVTMVITQERMRMLQ